MLNTGTGWATTTRQARSSSRVVAKTWSGPVPFLFVERETYGASVFSLDHDGFTVVWSGEIQRRTGKQPSEVGR